MTCPWIVGLALVLLNPGLPIQDIGTPVAPAAPTRVGRLLVIGNTVTSQQVILDALAFEPGQILLEEQVQQGEKNLRRLGIFKVHPTTGAGPKITIAEGGEFRDVLIHVEETRTDSWRILPGTNRQGEALVSLIWEQRNFDPWRWPTSLEDWNEGRAFRGQGICFRLEVIQIALLPRLSIRCLQWGSTHFSFPR